MSDDVYTCGGTVPRDGVLKLSRALPSTVKRGSLIRVVRDGVATTYEVAKVTRKRSGETRLNLRAAP